ncbi:MAG: hypothetical protein LVQ63_00080 [Thermoplasmatales archaeon]|nr:hypothetical protein [Thermoplasmatales archaeon]
MKILESIYHGASTKEAVLNDLKGLLPDDLKFGLNLLVKRRKIALSNNTITLTDSAKKHQLTLH